MNKINSVLKEVLAHVKPSKEELKKIEETLSTFLKKIKNSIKARKLNAGVFVGGSWEKGTIIRKDSYDIDIFIRFDRKYKNELLSDMTKKILPKTNLEKIHGSRDYFKTKARENLFFEVIPVKRVRNPKEAENVTDLSYSHVDYVRKKIKSEKLLDEIRMTKAFCYANGAYGAESYVRGFSGYGLELLVYHYGSFVKFIKAVSKFNVSPDNKIVIDIEKHHKGKSNILMDLNDAKLKSPIVLIDPTYKQRNVLAALSEETLEKFQKSCVDFLKNPSVNFFKQESVDIKKLKDTAKAKGYEFLLFKIKTDRQEGDIAGSKLLKFSKHLEYEASRFFDIKAKGFEYGKGKTARTFFAGKKKGNILVPGPDVSDKENVRRFRAKHRTIFVKNSQVYAKINVNFTLKEFLQDWKAKNKKKMRDMYITKLEIVG